MCFQVELSKGMGCLNQLAQAFYNDNIENNIIKYPLKHAVRYKIYAPDSSASR